MTGKEYSRASPAGAAAHGSRKLRSVSRQGEEKGDHGVVGLPRDTTAGKSNTERFLPTTAPRKQARKHGHVRIPSHSAPSRTTTHTYKTRLKTTTHNPLHRRTPQSTIGDVEAPPTLNTKQLYAPSNQPLLEFPLLRLPPVS